MSTLKHCVFLFELNYEFEYSLTNQNLICLTK